MPDSKPLSKPPFISVRQVGLGGLVSKAEAQDIKEFESPDLRNIVYDGGISGPRFGTTLVVAKPTAETNSPLQLMKAKDSIGTQYLLSIFGPNYYLYDRENVSWIPLNNGFTPTETLKKYGYISWNAGSGDDRLYFGNGYDDTLMWQIALGYLASATLAGDKYVTLDDSSTFPDSGTLILMNGATPVVLTFSGNDTAANITLGTNPTDGQTLIININGTAITITFVSSIGVSAGNVLIAGTVAGTITNLLGLLNAPGTTNANQVALSAPNQVLINYFTYSGTIKMTPSSNVYNLSVTPQGSWGTVLLTNPLNRLYIPGTVGQVVPVDSAVTLPITDKPLMPKGRIFTKFLGALVISNGNGTETTLNASKAGDPETFTPGANIGDPFIEVITTGTGPVMDVISFGTFMLIGQGDLWQTLNVTYNSGLTAQQIVTTPVISGVGMGPLLSGLDIAANNAIYYPTDRSGIWELVPATTGSNSSTQSAMIADNIYPTVTNLPFTFNSGRGEVHQQKIYWLVSSFGVVGQSNDNLVNNLVLVYDLIWKNWSLFDNWNAVDIKEYENDLNFLCNDDGGLYLYDQTSFQDARSGQTVGFSTYLYTKRFDFGAPANPKQQSKAMIQGYITQNTKLYVDVLYNEGGSLATSTYIIDGNNTTYVTQIAAYGLGRFSLGQNPLGGAQIGTIGSFRLYLDLLYRAGAHVIQMKFYTMNAGDSWAVSGIATNPEEQEKVPTELVLGSL